MKHEKPPLITVTTLGALLAAIAVDPSLSDRARQDLTSGIRSFCRHLGLDPDETEANFFCLRGALKGFHPRIKGIEPKTWANIRSQVTAAMNRSGAERRTSLPGSLDQQWRTVHDLMAAIGLIRRLTRFMNFCAERGIEPVAVRQQTFDAFLTFLEHGTLNRHPKRVHQFTCVAWNRAAQKLPELCLSSIVVPCYRDIVSLPLSAFPATFGEDLEEWEAVASHKRLFDHRCPPRPLRPATININRHYFIVFASALVRSGVAVEQLTSLGSLVANGNFKRGLLFLGERKGGKTYPGLHNIAHGIVGMATHWAELPADDLKPLKELKSLTACRKRGMTDKNNDRLRVLMSPDNRRKFYLLPLRLVTLSRSSASPKKAALKIQSAVAIELLLMTAMRMKNLTGLRIDRHFQWEGSGTRRQLRIVISGDEVKNSVRLEYVLPPETSRLVAMYTREHLPILTTGAQVFLFPGARAGESKNQVTLAGQLKKTIAEELGIEFNPHLVRHFAALAWLEAHPGEYETVRRLLHNKSIETILNNYTGPEVVAAMQRFDEHILSIRGKSLGRKCMDIQ